MIKFKLSSKAHKALMEYCPDLPERGERLNDDYVLCSCPTEMYVRLLFKTKNNENISEAILRILGNTK